MDRAHNFLHGKKEFGIRSAKFGGGLDKCFSKFVGDLVPLSPSS